jgi:hypothetical protein
VPASSGIKAELAFRAARTGGGEARIPDRAEEEIPRRHLAEKGDRLEQHRSTMPMVVTMASVDAKNSEPSITFSTLWRARARTAIWLKP